MTRFTRIEEVLNYAIQRERQAHDFYVQLAGWVERPDMSRVLENFAAEEQVHREILEDAKAGRIILGDDEVGDLGIAESIDQAEPEPNMEYADALVLAMKREKQAFRLYMSLAEAANDPGVAEMFTRLAQEEAQHKLRFELEYNLATF